MQLVPDMPTNKYFIVTVAQIGVTLEMDSALNQEDFTSELAFLYKENGFIKGTNSKGAFFVIKDFAAIIIFNETQYKDYVREQERAMAQARFNLNGR